MRNETALLRPALALAIAAITASCSVPSPELSPGASVVGPTAPNSASPQPSASGVHVTGFLEAATDAIPVFGQPSRTAERIAEVPEGQVVYALRAVDGWVRLEFRYLHPKSSEYLFGWSPVEVGEEPAWRAATTAGCGQPAIAALASMTPQERLLCFGSEPFQLEGWAVLTEPGPSLYSGEPQWLATPTRFRLMGVPPQLGGPSVEVHLAPDVGMDWTDGSHVAVAIRLDHEASATCERSGPSGYDLESDAESLLWCQQQLVVEDIGTVE